MTDTPSKSPTDSAGQKDAPHDAGSEAILKQLGPGLITGAADDDPSGIATYSQAGAQFGFNLLWLMLLTYPLMSAIQMISGRIGRVTGCGLAANLRTIWPRPMVIVLVGLLFVANTINIGANLSAMGASAELATGLPSMPATIAFAVVSFVLQIFVPYHRYASYLKWLTMVLLSYVAVLFVVEIDWLEAAKGFVLPSLELNGETFTVIVAILGTTISPYLFFWQTSQEVEEINGKDEAHPLRVAPRQAKRELKRIRIDTFAGMAISKPRRHRHHREHGGDPPCEREDTYRDSRRCGGSFETRRRKLRLRAVQHRTHWNWHALHSSARGLGRLCRVRVLWVGLQS